jgi:hypothetical protein
VKSPSERFDLILLGIPQVRQMGGFGPLYFQVRDVSVFMGGLPIFRMQLKLATPRPSSTDIDRNQSAKKSPAEVGPWRGFWGNERQRSCVAAAQAQCGTLESRAEGFGRCGF